MLSLDRLVLTDFRNYAHLVWQRAARISVLSGPNGSGKTNLLEAVSLLVPGRGLRGARLSELPRVGASHWAVAARLAHGDSRFEIGTGTAPDAPAGRRVFRLDGLPARNRGVIAAQFSAVWLTPQMDRLFSEGPASRRRFLDRLVLALDPDHGREVAAHDEALQGRSRLLLAGAADAGWLSALEHAVARHAVAVAAARRALVASLNRHAGREAAAPSLAGFPPARLTLECLVAARLESEPALAVEDWLRDGLQAARRQDAGGSGTGLGAHRADLRMADLATGRSASMASTGQQKALLIGTLLSHAALIAELRGEAPMLLLDEPLVHLDRAHRAALFAALLRLEAPVLLTGTDPEPFAALAGASEILRAGCGKLVPETSLGALQAGSGGSAPV